MKFSKSFRGYNVAEVDNYIQNQQQCFDEVTATQKERIFELVDENGKLQQQLDQYRLDEKAISQSLVESNKLAVQLKNDAENYSKVVLQRAKVFYATWQSYAKTMLTALSSQEVAQFNLLLKKIEQLMQDYQGDDTAVVASQQLASTVDATNLVNPVNKVANASGHAIDLAEILKPEQSLEELCGDLGLI